MSNDNSSNNSGGSGNSKSEMKKKAEADTQVSAYEREINKQKTAEKAVSYKTTNTTTNNNREDARSTNYTTQPKNTTFEISKKSFDDATGKSKLDNYQVSKNTGSLVLNSFQKARQKMFETNRKFFQEKVLTSKNRGNYEDTFDSYSKYINSRMSGETDAYGNVNPNFGRDGNNSVKTEKEVAKESEKEMETTTTPEDEEAYKKRKGLKGSRSLFSTGGQRGFFN